MILFCCGTGELLMSSLLRPDLSAKNFGFRDEDPPHKVVDADESENADERPKVRGIKSASSLT